jgi:hypothetical protein
MNDVSGDPWRFFVFVFVQFDSLCDSIFVYGFGNGVAENGVVSVRV